MRRCKNWERFAVIQISGAGSGFLITGRCILRPSWCMQLETNCWLGTSNQTIFTGIHSNSSLYSGEKWRICWKAIKEFSQGFNTFMSFSPTGLKLHGWALYLPIRIIWFRQKLEGRPSPSLQPLICRLVDLAKKNCPCHVISLFYLNWDSFCKT